MILKWSSLTGLVVAALVLSACDDTEDEPVVPPAENDATFDVNPELPPGGETPAPMP